MTTPLVSVLTPAHDVGPWVGEAIDSVTAQGESRFEPIVVDDGSTDDTAAVVRQRAGRDRRPRLVCSPNRGSGAACNLGLRHASAPFVAFLDGDDRWHPEFLRRQLAVFDRVPATVGAVFCHS